MYLTMLNEKQKQLFLGVAYFLTKIDGDYSIEEKRMIDSYCYEMQMDFNSQIMNKPIEDIINEMQMACGERERRIIIFEMVGLAMSDCNYGEEERKFISALMEKFGLKEKFGKECEKILNEYIEFQNRINKMIL